MDEFPPTVREFPPTIWIKRLSARYGRLSAHAVDGFPPTVRDFPLQNSHANKNYLTVKTVKTYFFYF
jgi:hypothetical protein